MNLKNTVFSTKHAESIDLAMAALTSHVFSHIQVDTDEICNGQVAIMGQVTSMYPGLNPPPVSRRRLKTHYVFHLNFIIMNRYVIFMALSLLVTAQLPVVVENCHHFLACRWIRPSSVPCNQQTP